MYAFCLFGGKEGMFVQSMMGKVLPDYAAADTGITGSKPDTEFNPKLQTSRQKRNRGEEKNSKHIITLDIPALMTNESPRSSVVDDAKAKKLAAVDVAEQRTYDSCIAIINALNGDKQNPLYKQALSDLTRLHENRNKNLEDLLK